MIEGAETEVVEQPQSIRDVVSEVVHEAESPEVKETRARDEAGRFTAAEKAAKEAKEAKQPAKEPPAKAAPAESAAPAYVAPKPPSTWKKELEAHWGKLPPEVHAEIARRESDYAKGVSTYKGEYDRLRPLGEALKPYEPMMQQAGLTPDKFIHALATTHSNFSSGNKETQLRELARFIQEYQIPVHEMLVQGEDGKVYFNQQYFQQQAQPQPQSLTQEDVRREAQQVWIAAEQQRQLKAFVEAKDASGNPLHQYHREVWQTMDGLLRAGRATDLPTAYQLSLEQPEHAALNALLQKQKQAADAEAKRKVDEEAAKKAKANVVSARPRTPTSKAANGEGRRSARDDYQEALNEVSGR